MLPLLISHQLKVDKLHRGLADVLCPLWLIGWQLSNSSWRKFLGTVRANWQLFLPSYPPAFINMLDSADTGIYILCRQIEWKNSIRLGCKQMLFTPWAVMCNRDMFIFCYNICEWLAYWLTTSGLLYGYCVFYWFIVNSVYTSNKQVVVLSFSRITTNFMPSAH